MTTFGFSAFLRLLSLTPKPQRREVVNRLTPSDGGYDFHRSLRLKAARLVLGGEDLADLAREAARLSNPSERRSVQTGLTQLGAWRMLTPGDAVSVGPALFVSPGEAFRVKFAPDFGLRAGGATLAVHMWNTSSVELSAAMTYVALALASSAYDAAEAPDDLAVLSLPDSRLYRLSEAPEQGRLSAIVVQNLEALFDSVRAQIQTPAISPIPDPPRPSADA